MTYTWEYFNSVPKKYTLVGKKLFIKYGVQFEPTLLNGEQIVYDLSIDNNAEYRKYMYGKVYGLKSYPEIIRYDAESDSYIFSDLFIEWMQNES